MESPEQGRPFGTMQVHRDRGQEVFDETVRGLVGEPDRDKVAE